MHFLAILHLPVVYTFGNWIPAFAGMTEGRCPTEGRCSSSFLQSFLGTFDDDEKQESRKKLPKDNYPKSVNYLYADLKDADFFFEISPISSFLPARGRKEDGWIIRVASPNPFICTERT